ncbi:MAG: dTDP-4-dehydrorhamnose reductase [Desulfopila sp.]|jgi:dTDP-4-dehydrorhamnose reductase|nr:dTDP-4-dehydrorhamnose reductase [Desulfopila sp.]
MKILIVGFDGQLGTDCRALLAGDHQVFTPTLAELDLCAKDSIQTSISATKPDVVINCAAYTAVDNCEKEQELCKKINSDGPEHLARACAATGSRLIHVSTDYVFDGTRPIPQPYRENDPVNPLSSYGRTKLEGEKAVAAHCSDYVILRTAWLYSANGPNFLKTMLRLCLTDPGVQRKVVNDQYGSLTWSHTLARQIALLLDSTVQGIVHTTADGYSTWYEAACTFLEKMAVSHNLVPCSTADYPTPAPRPKNSILANTVLDTKGISVFKNWQDDLSIFVETHGEALLKEQ